MATLRKVARRSGSRSDPEFVALARACQVLVARGVLGPEEALAVAMWPTEAVRAAVDRASGRSDLRRNVAVRRR